MRVRPLQIPLLLMVGLLLGACGRQAQAVPTQAVPTQVVPTQAVPTQAPVAASDLAAIPQGRTEEGYQFLGVEGAPVTLTMYSDFF